MLGCKADIRRAPAGSGGWGELRKGLACGQQEAWTGDRQSRTVGGVKENNRYSLDLSRHHSASPSLPQAP